jgi:hypothetical protein
MWVLGFPLKASPSQPFLSGLGPAGWVERPYYTGAPYASGFSCGRWVATFFSQFFAAESWFRCARGIHTLGVLLVRFRAPAFLDFFRNFFYSDLNVSSFTLVLLRRAQNAL